MTLAESIALTGGCRFKEGEKVVTIQGVVGACIALERQATGASRLYNYIKTGTLK